MEICECYFHLSQSFFRHVKDKNLLDFYNDSNFRNAFKLMQSIAYLPECDVVVGLSLLKDYVEKKSTTSFISTLDYFEKTYIGNLKKNSRTVRNAARYPIKTWNLHQQVLNRLPMTNNSVESWHGAIKEHDRVDMKICKLIEFLRVEQANTETYIAKIKAGYVHKVKTIQKDIFSRIFSLVTNYKKTKMFEFMSNVNLNFELELIKID